MTSCDVQGLLVFTAPVGLQKHTEAFLFYYGYKCPSPRSPRPSPLNRTAPARARGNSASAPRPTNASPSRPLVFGATLYGISLAVLSQSLTLGLRQLASRGGRQSKDNPPWDCCCWTCFRNSFQMRKRNADQRRPRPTLADPIVSRTAHTTTCHTARVFNKIRL